MKGEIDQWKDGRGFGFIQPNDGSEKVFFHISSVKTDGRRPQVGDSVLYEAKRDSQQRLEAKAVVIEGVFKSSRSLQKGRSIETRTPRKNVVGCISILVFVASTIAAGFEFYRTNAIESMWPFGLSAVIALFVLSRQKKPKEKSFRCSRCRTIAEHDSRTIRAWSHGLTKFYCRPCHLQWLKDNPRQEHGPKQGKSVGCLGVLALLLVLPALAGFGIYQWLA